jgi:hypothetical protein
MTTRVYIMICFAIGFLGCTNHRSVPTTVFSAFHEVRSGERLEEIAAYYYGPEALSKGVEAIIHANPWIKEQNGIRVKDLLVIPQLEIRLAKPSCSLHN